MIFYIENPKVATQKLLEFSKVVRYKISLEKSAAFLYTNNETPERNSFLKIPFKITLKKIPRNELNQGGERFIC